MSNVREELVSLDSYNEPAGGEVRVLTTPDGLYIRAARWPAAPATPERGTIVLFNGRTEFIEKYYEVIGELRGRGFAVVTLDWRGQGLSSRMLTDYQKGFVASFSDYVADAVMVLDAMLTPDMPGPHYMLAHSMGGNIGLRMLQEFPERFEKAVLCAPMTGLAVGAPNWLLGMVTSTYLAFGMELGYAWGNGPVKDEDMNAAGNTVTSDHVRFRRTVDYVKAKPELVLGGVTWSWLHEALRSISLVTSPARMERVTCPVMIASAGKEHFVSPASHQKVARLNGLVTVRDYPDAMHEILQETDHIRARFWDHFDRFMG